MKLPWCHEMVRFLIAVITIPSLLPNSYIVVDASIPCDLESTIEISGGKHFGNGSILHEGNLYMEDEYFRGDNGSERGCVCKKKACISRCCPEGTYRFHKYHKCSFVTPPEPLMPPFQDQANISSDKYHIFHHNSGCIMIHLEGQFEIDIKDGSIFNEETRLSHQKACFDHILDNETLEIIDTKFGECYHEDNTTSISEYFLIVGLFISSPFLFVTFCVYVLVPDLRNIHGKCVMNLVLSLLIALPSLAIAKIMSYVPDEYFSQNFCIYNALVTYFFLLASFIWMNIMCIDIYLTFSKDFMTTRMSRHSMQYRRFRYYLAYGWLTPTAAVLMINLFQYHPGFKGLVVDPEVGVESCWIKGDAELYYLYVPMSIIIFCNILLFSLTSFQMLKIHRQTSIIRQGCDSTTSQFNGAKKRYAIYLKLFIIMGIPWLTEIVSFAVGGANEYWIVPDFINVILGVYIFFIFVWKQKTRNLVIKRFHNMSTKNSYELGSSYKSRTTFRPSMSESVTDQTVTFAPDLSQM